MYKRISRTLWLALCVALLGVVSCKKGTFNINDTNPNNPTPAAVSPQLLLSGAVKVTADIVRGGLTMGSLVQANAVFGDPDYMELYMGYWAVSGDYIPVTTTLTYQTTTDYGADNWNSGYLVIQNLRQLEALSAKDPNGGYYGAMGRIMEAFNWQRLVDQYNDVPYSQALQGGTIDFPKYDKGVAVYDSCLVLLNAAIDSIVNDTSNVAIENPGNYDILFGGNMDEWIQFANTLKLKLAMNLTQYSGGAAFITSALQGTSTYGFLSAGEDVAVQPGYTNSSEAQQSPFYFDMGLSTAGAPQQNESYYRACSYIVNFMAANSDPRSSQMFALNTDGVVAGRPFGSNVSIGQDNEHVSGMGPGLLGSASSPAVILPASESFFLQAEAVLDGYLPGSAGTLYQNGVEESFRLLQVSNPYSSADAYIQAQASNPNVGFAASPNQLTTVITQAWVAYSGVDPLASWNSWRKLGIPTSLPVSEFDGSTATHVPYRLLYPTSEYSYNTANVNAEGTINNMTSTVFWMPQ
jgi:Starch-binding associating with outer membrane